jgi:G:T-mismatch repair DNA endonuclease (very short patch repair protein)
MFYIKLRLKRGKAAPFLIEILDALQTGFQYILNNLRSFYNPSDHNIAYMTFFQEPMVNGLNTGAFDIHEGASEMVKRLLQILNQFLISNQSLKVNDTFKVYVKVLSVEHVNFKAQMPKKKIRKTVRKHYGSKSAIQTKFSWAIDVPNGNLEFGNIFENKCLLTSTILGIAQNNFFKSNRKDKTFLYLQNLNSSYKNKQKHAFQILIGLLNDLLNKTKLPPEGPYDVQSTLTSLSTEFNCQFFIFDAIHNSTKLQYMYPTEYNNELMPIYLYQPFNNPDHVMMIKNLNSYFKKNVKICFYCKKTFKSYIYRHLCTKVKVCFSCRRPFLNEKTYIHEKLLFLFCDKNTNKLHSSICSKCNVTLNSPHCAKGHKTFCYGKGTFGWKCLLCKKFTYRFGKNNSMIIQNEHKCDVKTCKFCFNKIKINCEEMHLCKLKKEKYPSSFPSLAFIGMQHANSDNGKCLECFKIKENFKIKNKLTWKDVYTSDQFPNLSCTIHQNKSSSNPNIIVIYKETTNEKGLFDKYVLHDICSDEEDYCELNAVYINYLKSCSSNKETPKNLQPEKKEDFKTNSKILQDKDLKTLNLMDKLIYFLTTKDWNNTTFISQDQDSLNYTAILLAFLQNGFCPKLIQNGRHIIFMEILSTNIRFLKSNLFINQTEIDLISTYNINIDYHFFPEQFNIPQNFDYFGSVPSVKYFYSLQDSSGQKTKKNKFVSNLKAQNYKWRFQRELTYHCEQNVWILLCAFLHFVKDCLEFETLLKSTLPNLNLSQENHLLPCGYHVCSLSGYAFKLFKLLYLNFETIFCVKNEYGCNGKNVSRLEHDWASYLCFENPEKEYITAFNSKTGQKYFKECIPDLYSAKSKESIFINGCASHSHFDKCSINKTSSKDSINMFGTTFQEANDLFENKLYKLLENNPNSIDKITILWECQFNKIKESNSYLKFAKAILKPHPLFRLKPRTCIRGSYSDVYRLKWLKNENPNETLYFLDVNGLFSYASVLFPFVVDTYDILIGDEVNKIKIKDNCLYYKNLLMHGSILLTILPPKHLFRPYLQFRTKAGKCVLTLCTKCCDNYSINCKHSDQERALTSCYFISEINAALKYGYKILFIYECHNYPNVSFILRDFVTKLNVQKLRHSKLFKNCNSNESKQKVCDDLNSKMKLEPPFDITLSNVTPNESKRFMFKQFANSFFGKFIQNINKPQTIFVRSQNNLEQLYFSKNSEIIDLYCLSDDICQVQILKKESNSIPNLKSNLYIGGEIVSYARQIIYEKLNLIEENGGKIFQVECDSIIFSFPIKKPLPLNICISESLGDFKNEIEGEILSYYSFGPKNYAITFKDKSNKIKTVTKISGLSLKNAAFENEIPVSLFDEFLKNFETLQSKCLPQLRTKKKKFEVNSAIEQCTFSNKLTKKRFLKKDGNELILFPFGFDLLK